jgi:hypothetical protein
MNTKYLAVSIAVILGFVACLPKAEAVVPPPPGGYPNFTTAAGDHALQALTLGLGNTAIGTFSLFSVTTGNFNTAVGAGSLDLNTADSNTATGAAALLFNTTGTENTANGTAALELNETGSNNTATGAFALFSNNSFDNTAIGSSALENNTIGSDNTAAGYIALSDNTTGSFNAAIGEFALGSNTSGSNNTAAGDGALANNTTGGFNTALGPGAGSNATTGSNNVYVGAGVMGVAGESNACYIASIFGQTSASGIPVLIGSDNRLGTATSSKRFKEQIKPMDKSSEAVLALKPVIFRYKKEVDSDGIPQFGLVAEDVEKVNPDLVVRDQEGKPYTVRYEAVNAMLLNEFLKEHREVQEQKTTIAQLKSGMEALTATVKEQAAQIQKVSAQLEASKPTPQVVNNP